MIHDPFPHPNGLVFQTSVKLTKSSSLTSVKLAEPFRINLENWFHEDLSTVKIFTFRGSEVSAIGDAPLAFAAEDSIFISETLAGSNSFDLTLVMVHEVAHIVQKRRGQSSRRHICERRLEEEADNAVLAFRDAKQCPDLSGDSAPEPRMWGPAGHFYTVYWVSRYADIPDSHAERLAFYAQMPDQVADFDAKQLGLKWMTTLALPDARRRQLVGNVDRFRRLVYAMQAGLHCLNGRESHAESNRREAILRNLPDNAFLDLSFGLGLHALGDSFAHRKPDGKLFVQPLGHFLAGRNMYEGLTDLGTGIDNISKHSDRYAEYCGRLLVILRERFSGLCASDRLSCPKSFGEKIRMITAETDEHQQIRVIRSFYPDRRSIYAPESPGNSVMPWEQFRRRYASLTDYWMFGRARRLADEWTQSPHE